jgi:hypothetical protein
MITKYFRPALLLIAAAVAATTAQSLWNADRTRAILLVIVGGICFLIGLVRIAMMKR